MSDHELDCVMIDEYMPHKWQKGFFSTTITPIKKGHWGWTRYDGAFRGGKNTMARMKVVATSGSFDLLHVDHIKRLQSARKLGDKLIVLLNSDLSTTKAKGKGRPIIPQWQRSEMLMALECVDGVIQFDEPSPYKAVEELRPDIYITSTDYVGKESKTKPIVESYGGVYVYMDAYDTTSTSKIITKILNENAPPPEPVNTNANTHPHHKPCNSKVYDDIKPPRHKIYIEFEEETDGEFKDV